jgi:hypothetical protein
VLSGSNSAGWHLAGSPPQVMVQGETGFEIVSLRRWPEYVFD